MQFFLSKAQKTPASSFQPQNLHIAVNEVQAVCFNPHQGVTGERSCLPALQNHSEYAPKYLSACIDTWWGTQTHRHKALANFGASVQTGDMQGFQTLSSLKLELRPDPLRIFSQAPGVSPLCTERRSEFSQEQQIKVR